jgi:hypothetical protein
MTNDVGAIKSECALASIGLALASIGLVRFEVAFEKFPFPGLEARRHYLQAEQAVPR